MPNSRLHVKVTVPPEVLAHGNRRKRELGCSSLSVLVEAMIRADRVSPIPGLADRVVEVEGEMREKKGEQWAVASEAGRERRWAK